MMLGLMILILIFPSLLYGQEQPMGRINFNNDWRFFQGDRPDAKTSAFDDKEWRLLNLPHDWSIEGDFSDTHPATNQGGALPGGIAWYRKSFAMPITEQGKEVYIDFDGIYRNSEVWINGHYLGKRPSGYTSFRHDLTPYIKFGDAQNVIAVRVDNSKQPNSRWYTGSGIYRNVWLLSKNKIAIDHWGAFVTTPEVSDEQAKVQQITTYRNLTGETREVTLQITLYDQQGKEVVSRKSQQILTDSLTETVSELEIRNPQLWSVSNPYLYQIKTQLLDGNEVLDEHIVPLGIRHFSFDAKKGFYLNGSAVKILGVCMHHDLGALGATVNKRAMNRQLEILREMGANAIRISHNPPAPEFLDLCDEMGFLVMDEAFDMWRKKKNKFDYALDFDEWHRQDLEDLIRRDRNHPSIIMWSIGNEIREQFDSTGIALTKALVDIVKTVDKSRPVTAALTETDPEKNFIAQAGALDILGFNYKYEQYDSLPINFPNQILIASETTSALASRGHYDLGQDSLRFWPPNPKEKFVKNGNPDHTVSAYDHVAAYWGTSHEQAWRAVKERDFLAGLFVWTGFDYLGEPVPYDYPARSSYYGIVDLAGFPKDVYYLYQSEWTSKPVLHVFPHWNWKVGEIVDVWAYYNMADEVELFLNGQSLGTQKKEGNAMHVSWKVPFEPGIIKAVSRRQGNDVLTKEVATATKPKKLRLEVDRTTLQATQEDLAFISVFIEDANGNLVPKAANELSFDVKGVGFLAGLDNGFQASLTTLKGDKKEAYNGRCLAIIQTKGEKGEIKVTVRAEGIMSEEVVVQVK
ncbi:DUF4982 domain-containing protein [Olivibacter sp. SDN3]|uniref:beta-galactosidase GalB n=1 Tax=Olivibacter sp. SDN3 TaxID=2764720 RepID=UPI00165104D8|nr:beta-galactosidase GalB [Olivibacter sp. SDN3]QNL52262.1 DUF4982 domain-containing protein [Olivibacter sp. SDN3]